MFIPGLQNYIEMYQTLSCRYNVIIMVINVTLIKVMTTSYKVKMSTTTSSSRPSLSSPTPDFRRPNIANWGLVLVFTLKKLQLALIGHPETGHL